MVQTVIPLTRDGNSLKITSAKYYIPSGRLIQKPNFMRTKDIVWGYDAEKDTSKKNEKTFYTSANREVKESGGIVPDITVESPDISSLVINLIMKSMFFNYALEYASHNGDLEKDFVIDNTIISDFKKFLKLKDFTYKNEAEEHIEALAKVIEKKEYEKNVKASFENLKKSIDAAKENDFENDLDVIKRRLRAEIAAKFWGTKGKYESQFKDIPEIQKAIEVIKNNDNYFSLLSSTNSK